MTSLFLEEIAQPTYSTFSVILMEAKKPNISFQLWHNGKTEEGRHNSFQLNFIWYDLGP